MPGAPGSAIDTVADQLVSLKKGGNRENRFAAFFRVDYRKIHWYIAEYPDNQQYGCDMEIDRIIDLNNLLEKKSFFLFGPRATGKSTLVSRQLSGSANIILF